MDNLNRQAAKSSEPSRTAKIVLLGVRIVACNKYALSLFGTDQEDMLGRSFLDLSVEFQFDGKLSADVLADRLSEASDGLGEPFNWLCQLTSGESFLTTITIESTTIRGQSYTQLLVVAEHDQNLASIEMADISTIIEGTIDAIFITDRTGIITFVNPAFENLYGYAIDEVVGQNLQILKTVIPSQDENSDFWNVSPESEAMSAEFISRTLTGRLIRIEASNNPILDANGELIGILGIHRDVTSRTLDEERVEAAHTLLERRIDTQVTQLVEANKLQRELAEELENTRKELGRHAEQLHFSLKVAEDGAESADLDDFFARLVTRIKEIFGYDHAQLFRFDREADDYLLVAGYGSVGEQMVATGVRVPGDAEIIAEAISTGSAVVKLGAADRSSWRLATTLPQTQCELALPIYSGDELICILDVQNEDADTIGEEDEQLLGSLSGLISTVIQNLRTRVNLANRVAELSRLQQLVAREGLQDARALRGIPPEGYRLSGEFDDSHAFPENHDLADTAPVKPGTTKGGKEVITSPMLIRGEVIGALGVEMDPDQPLSGEERELIESISAPVAEAVESARLLEQTRKHAVEMGVVAQVSATASTILDAEKMLQSVVTLTRERFDLNCVSVFVLEDGSMFQVASATDNEENSDLEAFVELEMSNNSSLVIRAALKKEPIVIDDARTETGYQDNSWLPETRSLLAVPLLIGEETLGAIELRSNTANRFTPDEVRIHSTLAAQVAVALKNAYLYARQLETSEKLREADGFKAEFLASMSHELRTPLNSIVGFADVLLEGIEGPLTERMREDVLLIRDNSHHLQKLIGDMLDLSRIEAGMMDLHYEIVDLRDLAREVVVGARALDLDKDMDIEYEVEANLDAVEADGTRLRQILYNLMSNAVKFTEKGKIALSIRDQGQKLLVTVSDTGIGISERHMPLVFEQYRQIDSDLAIQHRGTGLGLPISRRLVELHGGEMWVESKLHVGSTFYFTIPKKKPRPRKKRTGTSPFNRPFGD